MSVFIGFILGATITSSIAQMMTNVKSVSNELGIICWGFAGGIGGIILAELILQWVG